MNGMCDSLGHGMAWHDKYCAYHHVAGSVAMDLVGNVNGSASVFGDGDLVFPFWLQVPDGVFVLGMLEQLINRHGPWGCHDESCLSGADGQDWRRSLSAGVV